MKKLKKIVLGVMTALFFVSGQAAYTANALEQNSNIKMNPEVIKKLKTLGFTNEEIKVLPEDKYIRYKDMDVDRVGQTESFYRITESSDKTEATEISKKEALKEVENSKKIDSNNRVKRAHNSINAKMAKSSWISLRLVVSKLSNGNYYVRNEWEWLSDPITTLKDGVAIKHTSNLTYVSGTYDFGYFPYYYKGKQRLTGIIRNSDEAQYDIGYVGAIYDITNYYNNYMITTNRGNLSAEFKFNSTTATSANLYGIYLHAKAGISSGLSFNSKSGSISLAGKVSESRASCAFTLDRNKDY